MREKIASESGISILDTSLTEAQFSKKYGPLSEMPSEENTPRLFRQLREIYTKSKTGQHQWLACQVWVRAWRDEIEVMNMEKIAALLQSV